MTRKEYSQLCDQLARTAIQYADRMAEDEKLDRTSVVCPKCERPAGEPCKFPIWASSDGHDAPEGFVHDARAVAASNAQREHWIDVFLDEHPPDVDTDVLLSVTSHADAYEKSAGKPAPSAEVAAFHAFQADMWKAINQTEKT